MKANFIYEYLDLRPKSSEEIEKAFSSIESMPHKIAAAVRSNMIDKTKILLDEYVNKEDMLKEIPWLGYLIELAIRNKYYEIVELFLQNKKIINYIKRNEYQALLRYDAINDFKMLDLLEKYLNNTIKENVQSVLNPKSIKEIIKNCDLNPKVLKYLISNGWVFTEKWIPRDIEYYIFERDGATITIDKYDDVLDVKRYISDTHL